MPSVESFRQQQYYAHPRNAFWPIMAEVFGINMDRNYQQRCRQLIKNHVALWDVLKSCHRPGSLDQHIDPDSIVANEFDNFLQHHPHIERIFFNGGKAEQVFKCYVSPTLDPTFKHITQIKLPSTSPAHASMTFEQKLQLWQQISVH